MKTEVTYQDFGEGDVPFVSCYDGNISLDLRIEPELRSDRDICGGYELKGNGMSVTARNESGRSLYCTDFQEQICEIGPGFSGMIPKNADKFESPPIVIEPCPYEQFYPLAQRIEDIVHAPCAEILVRGRKLKYLQRLCTNVRENIGFYLDPQSNVIRYIGTFRDIINHHPELHGILEKDPYHSFSADYYDFVDGEFTPTFRELRKKMRK